MGDESFEGCLVFDECHKAKNLNLSDTSGTGAKCARACHSLQMTCRLARVVYSSATGVSEPSNMGNMSIISHLYIS